jgi:two-component system, NarL family, nitrate/nitrite response regulator NarL
MAGQKRFPLGTDDPTRTASSRRILLVDDFEPWRRAACSIRRKDEKLNVVGEASDGLEAVRKAKHLKPELVLLDVNMPHLNGFEAAIQLYEALPAIKILFVTEITEGAVLSAALDNGQGYVLKSHARSDLLPAIEAVLRGEKFVSRQSPRE